MSFSWESVQRNLLLAVSSEKRRPPLPPELREEHAPEGNYRRLDAGQRASLSWIAKQLPKTGVVLADEVGTGKTRISCAVVHAVLEAGGRAAVVVPHGLMHQWLKEAHTMGMPVPKSFTSLRDFIEDAKEKVWKEIAPVPGNPEWLLVSHGFRTPQVRQGNNPAEWRVALPSYARAELTSPAERNDHRTLTGRLLQNPHKTTQTIAKELISQVKGHQRVKLRSRLDSLELFRPSGDNGVLIEALRKENGRRLVEDLLGLWLGEFALIVIDEAHKSRGKVEVEDAALGAASGKVLARLIDNVLKQPENGRRLCLTATPMELELSGWLDLLCRARSSLNKATGKEVVEEFQNAARGAAIAADEGTRLDRLVKASTAFEKNLNDYVTRRRRDDDPFIATFREAAAIREGQPHPHRRIERVQIPWPKTLGQQGPSWPDVLFAAECMSQSARGLKQAVFESALQLNQAEKTLNEKKQKRLKHLIRDLYVRIASGHLSADIFDNDVHIIPPDRCDDITRGKLQRTGYWLSKIRGPMRSGLPEDEHPRILAAVTEIEGWTLKREKVLVFGVFLRPLRLLRDVLNVRHAIRGADAGRPSAHAIHNDAALFKIAHRQLDRLRAERALSGRLSNGNDAEMRHALADSHKAYERLREKVRRRAKKSVVAWRADPSLLRGAPIDHELEGELEDDLVSFVLDDFLAMTSESDDVTDERFDALTKEFVEERLRPLLSELGDENAVEERAVLRRMALRTLLEDDDGRQSFHARLLQGATRWETRRYLQAAFNRPGASPWVLIAQSQVGREGLNLHESCRVVVQFHAEWNPAVLEQQIGRVDRKGSLWEQRANKWLANGTQDEPPFVEVRQLIFEGTYDAFQWERVMRRQHVFDASLFGSLLPADAWERVPDGRKIELQEAAPSFSPAKNTLG